MESMSEPQPTYTTRPRPRHDDAEANAAVIIEATRRETTAAALADADAATAALSALMGEVERLSALADSGALGDGALAVVGYKLRDLRRQVEALGVGL